jgi:hypothetical protein
MSLFTGFALTDDGDRHATPVRCGPMLPEVESLPRSQIAHASPDRNCERILREDCPDMSGHVIGPLGRMPEDRIAVGYKPGEIPFEI